MSSTRSPHKVYSMETEPHTYTLQLLRRRSRNQGILIYFLLGVTFCLICAVTYLSLKQHFGGPLRTVGNPETIVNDLGNETQFISGNNLQIEPSEEINSDRSDKTAKKDRNTPKNNYRPRPASHHRLNFTATKHKHNGYLVWQTQEFDGVTFIQGRMKMTKDGCMVALIGGVYDVSVRVRLDTIDNHITKTTKYNAKLSIRKKPPKNNYVIAEESVVTLYRGEYREQFLRMNLRLRRNEGFCVVASWQFLYKTSVGHSLDISLID